MQDENSGGEKICSNTLYSLDRDLEKTFDEVRLAQNLTTENP
jgi:hypothetical protein